MTCCRHRCSGLEVATNGLKCCCYGAIPAPGQMCFAVWQLADQFDLIIEQEHQIDLNKKLFPNRHLVAAECY